MLRLTKKQTKTHRLDTLPKAVVLSLQVVVGAVDQVAKEASVDRLRQLVSVLLRHLHCVAPSDHVA